MAALSASSVTYSMQRQAKGLDSRNCNLIKLTFGDGVLTYPAGGVPITIGNLGCPTVCESMSIVSQGTSGYFFAYDSVNAKLVISASPSHTHNILLKNAAVADGATARVNAGANLLGANTGGDLTITGGGANGGVVATTIGAGAEITAVAIAAQTIYVECVGW